jgi:hypothetical protein
MSNINHKSKSEIQNDAFESINFGDKSKIYLFNTLPCLVQTATEHNPTFDPKTSSLILGQSQNIIFAVFESSAYLSSNENEFIWEIFTEIKKYQTDNYVLFEAAPRPFTNPSHQPSGMPSMSRISVHSFGKSLDPSVSFGPTYDAWNKLLSIPNKDTPILAHLPHPNSSQDQQSLGCNFLDGFGLEPPLLAVLNQGKLVDQWSIRANNVDYTKNFVETTFAENKGGASLKEVFLDSRINRDSRETLLKSTRSMNYYAPCTTMYS